MSRGSQDTGTNAMRWLDHAILSAVCCALTFAYFRVYYVYPVRPHAPLLGEGWWSWFDQGKYLQAAMAWAKGDLNADAHYYLPGYPLLGAPFIPLTQANPFLIPNLACLVTSCWLFTLIAGRLCQSLPYARSVGALTFLMCNTNLLFLSLWVVPMSTTASTPLIFACLLAGLRFIERPRGTAAFIAGLCGGAIGAFRPADSVALLLVSVLIMGWMLSRSRPGWHRAGLIVLCGGAGLSLSLSALLTVHVAVNGFHLGPYLAVSRRYGLEWGLVPMQWVTIMLDPRPLFADQRGLSEVFPWIMPGIAGMAACLIVSQRGSERPGHILIVGSLSTYVVLYLAYRGLNPDWLWRYNLYHYFQWILPLFALYAVLLVFRLASPAGTRWRTAVSAAAALVILLPWRVEVASAGAAPQHANGGGITIPGGLPELGDSAIIEANGGNTAILMGDHRLMIGQHQFANLYDFQAYPRQSGLMITPLRRLPSGDARIILGPGITVHDAGAPRRLTQRVVFGWPCWFALAGNACVSPEANRLADAD